MMFFMNFVLLLLLGCMHGRRFCGEWYAARHNHDTFFFPRTLRSRSLRWDDCFFFLLLLLFIIIKQRYEAIQSGMNVFRCGQRWWWEWWWETEGL